HDCGFLRSGTVPSMSHCTLPTHTAQQVLTALVTCTCVAGMAGNGVVVWLRGFRVQRGRPGRLHPPPATLTVLDARSQVNHLGHQAVKSVKYLAYTSGLSLLTAASAQLCLSILFPTWYHSHRRTRLSGLECARLWLLSLMVTMLASFFHKEPGNPHLRQGSMVHTIFHILTLVGFTPIMVLSGVVLFIQLQKSSRPWQWQPTRLYVALLASVFVFLICALTVGVSRFILHPLHPPQQTKTLFSSFECLLSSLRSDAKPIIYFLAGSRGSQSLRELLSAVLSRALQEEPEPEGKEMPSSGANQVGV
uniref:G-protein coupled receptors family 1 profile domain-containing protein n=1 Tax=Equus caballus TaxID=9796 RepID=A0A3Q2IFT3_HORSE